MLKPTVSTICTDLAIASTATVYTDILEVTYEEVQTLFIETNSAGVIALTIEPEYSIITPMANVADTRSIVDPLASAITISETTFGYTAQPYSPILSKNIRFKITGTGSNDAATTISLNICRKDKVN